MSCYALLQDKLQIMQPKHKQNFPKEGWYQKGLQPDLNPKVLPGPNLDLLQQQA